MNKLIYILTSIFLCTLFLASCYAKDSKNGEDSEAKDYSAEKMTAEKFLSWSKEEGNGLNRAKEVGDMQYKLSYLPSPVMAFLELRTQNYDTSKFRTVSGEYDAMSYFNFRIEIINGKGELLKHQLSSAAQYEARVKYFSFSMEKDICLVQGQDTLYPGLFQFERTFEVVPYANVMFAFDNKMFNKNEEFTIVYNDKVFEKGFIKFNYKNKQLINLPKITEL